MKVSQGSLGRVFVIRLEDGDVVPDALEQFAEEQKISHALAVFVGGANCGRIVVGPRDSEALPPDPMLLPISGAHEVLAMGVLAPMENAKPVLHMHGALGRLDHTSTGCFRHGVRTWLVGEVILYEILGVTATRVRDAQTNFCLLVPGVEPSAAEGECGAPGA